MLTAGFLHEDTALSEQDEKYATFHHLLRCDAPNIRLQAFRLLTASNTTNAPVPAGSLNCLSGSLRSLHDDTDAYYRDEYLSIARGFLNRLRRSDQAILRKQNVSAYPISQEMHANYAMFLVSWLSFLRVELAPQVSYQRHILALNAVQLILSIYGVDEVSDILSVNENERLVTALLDLVFDAYEDVRSEAVSVLKLLSSHRDQLVTSTLSERQLLDLGQNLSASTNRADHADATGRLHALQICTQSSPPGASTVQDSKDAVLKLAKSIERHTIEISTVSPTSAFPLHGTILGLYHTVTQSINQEFELDTATMSILLGLCHRIWVLVKEDLCVDSPETATNEEELDGMEGPKDLLAYSWRALRDSRFVHLQRLSPS